MDAVEITGRLVAAAAAGGVLGAHFELRSRAGGLRTHILTTVAAALFCITVSRLAGAGADEIARMMQGIASGVGFIGAASVLRREGHVEGVSNAASLWITAAIGCEAGAGNIAMAIGIAIFVAIVTMLTLVLERRWLERDRDGSERKR